MRAIASFACGLIFGFGLLLSGMLQPAKVLGFLDVFGIPGGTWDPTLAVVMAAALAVSFVGFTLLRPRRAPLFDAKFYWPTASAIDRPLVAGAVLFGAGWGLAGLCPGPAIENLATLSPPVILFVAAMALGMVARNVWQARSKPAAAPQLAPATAADG